MYSFLFCSSPDHAGVQRRLQAAGETVFRMMPVVETTVAYHITMLRDDIGWCIIGPETPQPRPYVSEHVEDDVAVLVFGVPSDGSPQTMAEIVGEAWKKGKAPSVKRLDHSFSAIIVDRTVRAVHLISDQLGLHSVEYYIEARQLWVSPHDIPLVAGSPCRLDINLLAVYSVLRIGWSLMGAPFLSDLSITDPRVSYTWKDGAMTTTKNHFFESVMKESGRPIHKQRRLW